MNAIRVLSTLVFSTFVFFAGVPAINFDLGVGDALACQVNCNDPTGVGKGKKAPIWHVAKCVIGPAGGPYTKVDCKSSQAVHTSPLGRPAVCFLGTDGKIHWDAQREVHVGRPFINRKVGGHWQPDWQDARPY